MQDIKEEKKDKKLTVDVTGINIDDDGYNGSLPNTPTGGGGAGAGPARLTLASSTDDMGVFTSSEEVLTAVPSQAAAPVATAAAVSTPATQSAAAAVTRTSKGSDDGVSLLSWESGDDVRPSSTSSTSNSAGSSSRQQNTVCTGAFSRALERYNSTIGQAGGSAKPVADDSSQEPV